MYTIFGDLRNNNPSYRWLQNISTNVIRCTLNNLDNAFRRFFSGQNKHPKFKSKKHSKKSFTTRAERCRVDGEYISISGLKDRMVLAKNHKIPQDAKMYNTTVSFDGINYWFSCTIETSQIDISDLPKTDPIGIDVGIVNMIATSDGEFYKYSDTSKYIKRHKRQQRRLSRYYSKYLKIAASTRTKYDDVPKSKNFDKATKDVYRTVQKIHNKKYNDIHTATKRIVEKNPSAIVIEDISVKEQAKNKWFRSMIPQAMYYEIHRQLQYKAKYRDIPVIKADKHFPSSKMCSNCGEIGKFLHHRIFHCPYCGLRIDRDLNAAYNLRDLAYQHFDS